jgi:transcriptional regulator with XRE-family HTH domain
VTAVRDACRAGFIADLRDARIAAGLTQARVAGLVGVSVARLSEFESGQVRVHPRVLDRWAAVLGLEVVARPIGGEPL